METIFTTFFIDLKSFYLDKISEDLQKNFSTNKSYFYFKNDYEITNGVVTPKKIFYLLFGKLQIIKPNFKPRNCNEFFSISKIFFEKCFQRPDFKNSRYQCELMFPLVITFDNKYSKVKLLYKRKCFQINDTQKLDVENFSPIVQKQIMNSRKKRKRNSNPIKKIKKKKIFLYK